MRSLSMVLLIGFGVGITATALALALEQEGQARVISGRVWHLGDNEEPDWPEGPSKPEGNRVELEFEGTAFEGEGLLRCQQRNVDNAWRLEINGQLVAELTRGSALAEHDYTLPAGLIVDGTNRLVLSSESTTDDITFGALRYFPVSLRELYDLPKVEVRVSDVEGAALPARVTILDSAGEFAKLYFGERTHTAVRAGVIYTSDGTAAFELPPGNYTAYASRGTEWSMAEARLDVHGAMHGIALALKREVDTTGFVAADTHIHTLTYSGHGDSSVEERLVTLAGEGVELAIATDHNHNTDYSPLQKEMKLSEFFTPIVGNEVSTPIGHLNAFPLDPKDEVPPYELGDIVKLVEGIREKGATMVILNHPRWPAHDTGPHGKIELDHHSGDWVGHWACPFDAVELINSDTEEAEPMLLFKDWFALLNRGEQLSAVGSSDSHAVGVVVGQGRTYIRSATDDPSAIDIESASENIARGRSSISMGIFADLRSQGASVMGSTLRPTELNLRVAAPSWVRAHTATVFANGSPIQVEALEQTAGTALDVTLSVPVNEAWPKHDFWLVAVVQGDGTGGKWWPLINDYTLAATNPVFVDVDGDGSFTHPRALAVKLLESRGSTPEKLASLLQEVDTAVAVQLVRLARMRYLQSAERAIFELIQNAALVHPELSDWHRERVAPTQR